MKDFFKEYLSFSKQDRNAVVFMIILIVLVVIIKYLMLPRWMNQPTKTEIAWQDSISKIFASNIYQHEIIILRDSNENFKNGYADAALPIPNEIIISINHSFNPNKYSLKDWMNAGFSEKFAKTITNYIAKGGKIRKPEDLKKVYGMKNEWYQKIEPFIEINDLKKEKSNEPYFQKQKLSIIEINTVDSAGLESLPLIGAKTAYRIIKYRDLIGGFISLNQLKEVWGFKDSMLLINEKRIKIDSTKITKIKINSVSIDELKKHPYLKFNKAKVLILYREQHGKYNSISDFKSIKTITQDDISKILPYLNFE
jgi:DNA uptake protein ComE-like DNA-binding protein